MWHANSPIRDVTDGGEHDDNEDEYRELSHSVSTNASLVSGRRSGTTPQKTLVTCNCDRVPVGRRNAKARLLLRRFAWFRRAEDVVEEYVVQAKVRNSLERPDAAAPDAGVCDCAPFDVVPAGRGAPRTVLARILVVAAACAADVDEEEDAVAFSAPLLQRIALKASRMTIGSDSLM
jgi:hypothetical protein